jgi:hypothetical protein
MGGEAQRFYANYRMLSTSDLKLGDILIVKDFGGPLQSGPDSLVVRSAQAVFSHVRQGSFRSEHCMLFARDTASFSPNQEVVLEAVETGVTVNQAIYPRQHLVYRFCGGSKATRTQMRTWAVWAGGRMAGRFGGTRVPFAVVTLGNVAVPAPKAVGSFFRSQKRGNSATKHLTALYNSVFGTTAMPKVRMICSEFVTTCYELAALHLSRQNNYPTDSCLGVDPRAVTAKALESALNTRPHLFKIVGRYQGRSGGTPVVGPPVQHTGPDATPTGLPGSRN